MPRALDFLTNFNDDVFHVQIRASYYFSFVTLTLLATGLAFQMPIFILALVRLRILTAAKLRRNRRIGIAAMLVFAILLPTVDPVSLALEVVPAAAPLRALDLARHVHGEALGDRGRALALGGRVRVISADWVLPVEGAPVENGAVAIEDGRIAAVGTIDDLGAGEHFAEAAIVPGIVNAHSHLEYAVYAGFGDGLSFAPWLATHIERKARIDRPQMEAIARLGAAQCLASGITTVGDAAFTGVGAHACAELGLRAIVYLEVFGRDPAEAMQQFEEKAAYVASARLRPGPDRRVAARSLHLLDRGVRRVPGARRAGDDALQREPGRARLAASRRRADEAGRAAARSTRTGRAGSGASPPPACSTRASSRRTASRSTPRRSACSPGTTSPSSIARARTRSSAAGSHRSPSCAPRASGSASAPTASPPCPRTTRSRSCAR